MTGSGRGHGGLDRQAFGLLEIRGHLSPSRDGLAQPCLSANGPASKRVRMLYKLDAAAAGPPGVDGNGIKQPA